jgi:hypothetical protein
VSAPLEPLEIVGYGFAPVFVVGVGEAVQDVSMRETAIQRREVFFIGEIIDTYEYSI